ncbi:MAG: PH domain-containing protein, partial [Planctomycetota bacterium]
MPTLDAVKHLDRPSRALFTVYLVRAVGVAIGIMLALGFIVLRMGGGEAVSEAVKYCEREGIPVFALGGLAFLVCYALAAIGFYVRFRTLRYRWDEDGLTRQYGLLFRRETFLAYKRIQDAKVSQGVVERFFGLGTVTLETASGGNEAESAVEGLREFQLVRDFLYEKMRGVSSSAKAAAPAAGPPTAEQLAGEVVLVN